VSIVIADVSNEKEVEYMVSKAVEDLGELWVMVANAGIVSSGLGISMLDLTLEKWQRVIDVNLTGTFLCYRAAARQLLKQGKGGRIIGASSMDGKRGFAGTGDYCASKFGIRGLTQSLASELGPQGITVNAYAPGVIDTELLDAAVLKGEALGGTPEEQAAEIGKRKLEVAKMFGTIVPRVGTPEDIAGLVAYLVSKEADFVTGQSVSINGGGFYD